MKITLTAEQKQQLEEQHKSETNSKICDRIKAVLLSSEGWTQRQIATALRVHETTVWGHLNDYLREEKLKPQSGGSSSKLDELQTKELIAHLELNTYPSTKEILEHVRLTYAVNYTQQGMHDWLTKHRFSYKKPKGTPAKFNTARQEEFIKMYEVLKATLSPSELIIFMDSVHPTQETKITYGWIRKGVEKLIATVASRKRINLTGAIDLNTMSLITGEYETIDGSSTVEFLKKVEAAYPAATKIHIIADGCSAHTSNEVALFLSQPHAVNRLYLEQNYAIELPGNNQILTKKIKSELAAILAKEPALYVNKDVLKTHKLTARQLLDSLRTPPPHPRLILHILPPYSPNLNPIERVWRVMNEVARNNRVFKTFAEFKGAIQSFFSETWDTISSGLKDRVNDKFQQLKPVV